MSDVHQCPKCELRFVNEAELRMHQSIDHPSEEPEAEPVYDDEGGGGGK